MPAGPFPFTDNPIAGAAFVEGRVTAFKVILKEVFLLMWPAKLSSDYSLNEIPVRIDAPGIVGILFCVSAAALAIWSWKRHRAVTFAVGLFFVTLAPVANVFLVIGSIMGERFLYLPAVGFAVVGHGRLFVKFFADAVPDKSANHRITGRLCDLLHAMTQIAQPLPLVQLLDSRI